MQRQTWQHWLPGKALPQSLRDDDEAQGQRPLLDSSLWSWATWQAAVVIQMGG
jgi:hypothetical protein